MPLLNGFECVKLIKHDETINKIPIVLYSTMADSSMLQQAIEKGAATCIKKQDSIHMLAGILKQMIIEPGSIYKE